MREHHNVFTPKLVQIVLAVAFVVFAGCNSATSKKEITEVDITTAPIRSDGVKVFGIYVGMPIDAAHDEAQKHSLKPEQTAFPGYYDFADTKGQPLISLKSEAGRVVDISLKPAMKDYVAGDAKLLFSSDIGDSDSLTRKRLLGLEDERREQAMLSMVTYSYYKEGVEITTVRRFPQNYVSVRLQVVPKTR